MNTIKNSNNASVSGFDFENDEESKLLEANRDRVDTE